MTSDAMFLGLSSTPVFDFTSSLQICLDLQGALALESGALDLSPASATNTYVN